METNYSSPNHRFHKGCFRCSDQKSNCNIQLNLKTVFIVNEKIYCKAHAPKPSHTEVADSVSVAHATHVPKKSMEGLNSIVVGTGEKPNIGYDSMSNQHGVSAPKKNAEGLVGLQALVRNLDFPTYMSYFYQ